MNFNKSAISLLLDSTLVAPFNTSNSAPSTSILTQFTSSCLFDLIVIDNLMC